MLGGDKVGHRSAGETLRLSADDLCCEQGISDAMFHQWRPRFDGMEILDARKLKGSEEENNRLKKLLAGSMLYVSPLKERLEGTSDAQGQAHSSGPEDDSGCDEDGGHEYVRASIVASVDAPAVFEPAEHVLDLVPLTIKFAVIFDRAFAVRPRWDAGHDLAFGESTAKPSASYEKNTELRAHHS